MIKFIELNIGNILNIMGTLFVAVSFGRFPWKNAAPYTGDGKGGKKYIAYFNYPYLFYFGLFLLVLGFCFQLKFSQ